MINNDFLLSRLRQVALDLVIFLLAYVGSFFLRFEGIPDPINLKQLICFFPFIAVARVVSFGVFSIYSIAWRYISLKDVLSIGKAYLPVSSLLLIGRLFIPVRFPLFRLPLSVIAIEFLIGLTGTLGIRMIRRLLNEKAERMRLNDQRVLPGKKRILLVGAGNAGNLVVKELQQRTDLGMDVLGFVDDDPAKLHTVIQGVKVIGETIRIPELTRELELDEIIITIANAASKDIRRIVDICGQAGIEAKIIPGLFELLGGAVNITKIRTINIDDLLGRNVIQIQAHFSDVSGHYRDRRILVTGAGGSIGSELCRQLGPMAPREIILLDKDENSIYEIDLELREKYGGVGIIPIIADIRNRNRLAQLFARYKPEIIFHAAAHKHVPLMERNVAEAILNNVLGTRNLARLADETKVRSFVFISTDKAVNPSSIMGCTKKIGEILIQEIAAASATRFSCVRFGNVLGSRGSVVPLFMRQIARGGPITITHPDVKRYFMSISEAVQLIAQAGTLGNKGEIFILDMGAQIKIVDLAQDLIRLSGLSKDNIDIRFVGMRPGEKLYEEILIDEEKTKATRFQKIFVAPPIEVDSSRFNEQVERLMKAAEEDDERLALVGFKGLGIGYPAVETGRANDLSSD